MCIRDRGFVAHTDAIIFDLRENGGGQPAMVTLIASYLFDQPRHLIDIYNRKEDSTTQNWTLSYLPGARLTKQPVFVLTSKRTFSGAEEFAFDLKNQKRATIVGETTGGGAHPVSGHTVADYFMVGVPFAKSLDPVTKTNWEGTGVEPDVKVPAADAGNRGEAGDREDSNKKGQQIADLFENQISTIGTPESALIRSNPGCPLHNSHLQDRSREEEDLRGHCQSATNAKCPIV